MTGAPLSIDVVTTRQGFEALSGDWERLWDRGGGDPFQSHDWHRCCLEAEPDRPIRIFVARRDGAARGIAPLWAREVRFHGFPARALAFITSSETARTDLLIEPEGRAETVRALVRGLFDASMADGDVVSLAQWPVGSENQEVFLRALAEAGRPSFTRVTSVAPFIPMAGDWDGYWSSLSYQFRKSRRGIVNRLGRAGGAEVVCLGGERAGEALDLYRAVAAKGWKQKDGLSLDARPETARFFRCLTETAGRRGWLMVWGLLLQGVPVAAEYDLACAGRVYALRADFDEAYSSHSPGAYLEYHLIKHLFENGYREYCAGPGRDSYKTRWTDRERTNVTVTACGRTLRGMTIAALEGMVVPVARRVRDSVRGTRRGEAE